GSFSLPFAGQPYCVSEYGGIWWNAQEAREAAEAERAGNNAAASWGYGERVRSEEELYERFEGLTRVLLEDPLMFGYCYTQLTDVFQEKNGVVAFARGRKLDLARLREVPQQEAAHARPSRARAPPRFPGLDRAPPQSPRRPPFPRPAPRSPSTTSLPSPRC